MEQKVLALYDFASKQEFIYRTSKIREISGASALLTNLYRIFISLAKDELDILYDVKSEFDIDAFDRDGEVLYDGGGNLMVLFRSEDAYLGFNRIASEYLLKNVPTLSMTACHVPFTGDFQRDRQLLYRRNRINKNRCPAFGLSAVTPMTQTDPMTFLPVVHKRTEFDGNVSMSADRFRKERAYLAGGKKRDDDLDNLEGWTVVIYIDGNSMGTKLMKCADSDYNRGVKKLREFSENVNRTYVTEPLKRMKEVICSSESKGFRQVVGGGDEITIICNAKLAIRLTEAYFEKLCESNRDLPEDEKNYACAGIAVFRAKSPFSIAYEIAEAACEEAKKKAHLKNGNYIDFYYCHSGITADFDTLRKREQRVTARPYRSEDLEAYLEKYVPLLQNAGRSSVKALGNAAQRGDTEYLFEVQRINSRLPDGYAFASSGEDALTEMKIICDMAEFYDIWFAKDGE